jgi:hypothetical protein
MQRGTDPFVDARYQTVVAMVGFGGTVRVVAALLRIDICSSRCGKSTNSG